MSSGGGKGGESKQELDPEMKGMAREVWNKGKHLSELAPTPYMGLTMAAPSEATKASWTNKNKAANALGLGMSGDPADGIQMQEVERNGMKGYSAFPQYQQELQQMWEQYPERMRALNKAMPGLMDPAKDYQPQAPQAQVPYDFSQIASIYTGRGTRR